MSQVTEIQTRCAVSVLSPRTSFFTLALPGPGSEIRRMMELTQMGKNGKVGALVVSGCPKKEAMFFILCTAADWVRKDRTTQRGRSRLLPRVLVHLRMDMARLSGHKLVGAVGTACQIVDGHRISLSGMAIAAGMALR